MIKQRNCKQCNKLFFPLRKNGISCSFDCSHLIRKRQRNNDYHKNYRNKSKSNNKKIKMPKFKYHDNNNYWDKLF